MKQRSHLMANSSRFQTSHWLWLGFSVQISFWFSPPPCVCLDQSSVWINHSIKRVANQGPNSPLAPACPNSLSLCPESVRGPFVCSVCCARHACLPMSPDSGVSSLSALCPSAVYLSFSWKTVTLWGSSKQRCFVCLKDVYCALNW